MQSTLRFVIYLQLILLTSHIGFAKSYKPQIKANATVRIEKEWNLDGKTITLPAGVTLNFTKTGKISNGHIVGSETQMKGRKERIFNNVTVSGTWIVPEIHSNMFTSLKEDNALRNLFALTSSVVNNKVEIDTNTYSIALSKSDKVGIEIQSNTEVNLKGTIKLKGNDLRAYDLIRIHGKNVKFVGSGSIIGDRYAHIDKGGEWGMGINIDGSQNVLIGGLMVRDCWGDCIYVGNNSDNVKIDKCLLQRGRRQGISITSAGRVTISNTTIKNVEGTLPEYAIDIEPNKNEVVKYVSIQDVNIQNCGGGIMCNGRAENSHIDIVRVQRCKMEGSIKHYTFMLRFLNTIHLQDCTTDVKGEKRIVMNYIDSVYTKNISVKGSSNPIKYYSCKKIIKE